MLAYGVDVGLIISILSLLASAAVLLSTRKPKLAPQDDALQSVATQGAFVPLVIGRQRLGPVFAFVEDATSGVASLVPQSRNNLPSMTSTIGTQGNFAKGGGGVPSAGNYHENALHILCIGPGSKLHKIWQNGEIIWEGPIDPISHPSGSLLPAGDSGGSEGAFEIHWGFPDDPILTNLQNSAFHGLPVRYSHVMKIMWKSKNLGPTRQWPRLEYEVTCPCYSQIATTPSEVPQIGDDARPIWSDWTRADAFVPPEAPGFPSTAKVQFTCFRYSENEIGVWDQRTIISGQPDFTSFFEAGGIVKIRTSAFHAAKISVNGGYGPFSALLPVNDTWKYYRIIRSYKAVIPSPYGTGPSTVGCTIVVLGPEVPDDLFENKLNGALRTLQNSDSAQQGWVEPLDTANRDGVNPIHIIDQLLFARYPYGGGKNRQKFDPRSIEYAAQVLHNERIRGGIQIKDGESLKSVLAEILQDLGLFIVWDAKVGTYIFNAVRYEESSVDLPSDVILEPVEAVGVMGSRPSDVTAFTFKDRQRNYREVPVKIFDSGQVSEFQSQRAKKIPIGITNDRDSVTRMVPRRQQEAMVNLEALRFVCNHGTVFATPGQRFTASSTEGPGLQFLIMEVQRYLDSSKVDIHAPIDAYNPPYYTETSGLVPAVRLEPGKPNSNKADVTQLQAFGVFEMPRAVANQRIQILVLGARKAEQTQACQIWASKNGITYAVVGAAPIVVSGVLAEGLTAEKCYDEDDHFVGFEDNVDVNAIEDLSLNQDSWRSGRQVMLIGSEIIYLREAIPDVNLDSKIRGLIRGRLGTRMQEHPEGTRFFILPAAAVMPIESSLFVPGKTVQLKAQAVTKNRTSNLEEIVAQEVDVQGLAFKPMDVAALRQPSLLPTYKQGVASVTLTWSYYSDEFKRTGLGTQLFGAPSGRSKPKGYFLVTLNGVKTLEVTDNQASIDLALRTTLGLDALTSWTVQVVHVEGSFTSDPVTLILWPVP